MSADDAKLSPSYGGASSKLLEIGASKALQLRHVLTPQLMATH
jgi:hypothetical protein